MKYHRTTTTLSLCIWILTLSIWFGLFFLYDLSFEKAIFGSKQFVEDNLIYWTLLFSLAYIVRPLFFIPASPFDLFSGMVFGPWYWFLVSSISTFFTSMFGYVVWKMTGWIFIQENKEKKFKKLKIQLHEHTFFTTMMMRFLQLPYDLTNYICWVLRVPFLKFVAWSTLWVLPATFVYVSAWAAFYGSEITSYETLLKNINYSLLLFASVFFIFILLVAHILKKKYKDIRF